MFNLNPQMVGSLVDLLQFIGLGVLAVIQYARKPGEDANSALPDMLRRLTSLEEASKHAASNADVAQLRASVEVAGERVANMQEAWRESQRRTDVQLNRIEQYLLDAKV